MPTDLISESFVRAQLRGIEARVSAFAEALDWATLNYPVLNWALYLPGMTPDQHEDLRRWLGKASGYGKRVYHKRKWGTLGGVSFRGDPGPRTRAVDLRRIADQCLQYLIPTGRFALMVRDGEGGPRISRLTGYLEPVVDDDDHDHHLGLIQVQPSRKNPSMIQRVLGERNSLGWRVVIYDYGARRALVWDGVERAYALGTTPQEIPLKTLPRLTVADTDQTGQPVGEFIEARSLLVATVADQVKLEHMSEVQAFSLLALKGDWRNPRQIGPSVVLESDDPSAAVERVQSGDFEPILKIMGMRREDLRDQFSLPFGILSADVPSGEALKQANLAFLQACQSHAYLLQQGMNAVLPELAQALGESRKDLGVEIAVNHEIFRGERMQELRDNVRAGLMPKSEAARQAKPYYPTWDQAEFEAWVEGIDETATGEDIEALFGGNLTPPGGQG